MPSRVLAALVATWTGWAVADVQPAPTVEQLIRQLSDNDFRQREAAVRALADRGDAVLPELRKVQPHPDPEVRQRLTQLIARMERESLLSPKMVTVHANQTPVTKIFEDLSQQTGYKLTVQPGPAALVTLHADAVPFWEAVDQVCRQTGLGLQPYYDNSSTMTFYRNGRGSDHVAYAGAFRVSAANFHLSRTLDLGNPPNVNGLGRQRNETLTFGFFVVGEPKVQLMSLGQTRVTIAVDDQGNSLVPPQGRSYETGYHNYYYGRTYMHQTQLQLLGPGTATMIRQLKATVPITILAEARPEIEIADILNVKAKKFDGTQVSIEIDEVKEGPGKQVRIRATARRNAKESDHDYSWTNSLGQRVDLLDADGNKFHADGFNWDSGSPTTVTGTFNFSPGNDPKVGKAAKFVYYNWITTQHQIDFEFKDLPLP